MKCCTCGTHFGTFLWHTLKTSSLLKTSSCEIMSTNPIVPFFFLFRAHAVSSNTNLNKFIPVQYRERISDILSLYKRQWKRAFQFYFIVLSSRPVSSFVSYRFASFVLFFHNGDTDEPHCFQVYYAGYKLCLWREVFSKKGGLFASRIFSVSAFHFMSITFSSSETRAKVQLLIKWSKQNNLKSLCIMKLLKGRAHLLLQRAHRRVKISTALQLVVWGHSTFLRTLKLQNGIS